MKPGEQNLRRTLQRLHRPQPQKPPLDLNPTTPFEVAIAEQLRYLRRDVDKLNSRLNWLFTLIAGAAVTNIVLALLP